MRFTTLAWFYNADDTLLHIRYLQFDEKTPNRFNNEFFGGTPIESFQYKLRSERQQHYYTSEYVNLQNQTISHQVPYWQEQLLCSAQIDMDINFHLTELFRHLTSGLPLSKIIVRHYEIDSEGRMIPHIQFTFKECWLFDHKTEAPIKRPELYSIKFTYCCIEVHYFDGNRFASHERCKALEPDPAVSQSARNREARAQESAVKKQAQEEAARLVTPTPEYSHGAPVIHRFDVVANAEFNKKPVHPGGLDEFAFHIVEKAQPVDALIDYLYDKPSEITRAHFKRINKHLSGGVALPAQVVIITPENTIRASEQEFLAQIKMNEIENYRQNLQIDPLQFSENFINYANLAGRAASGMSFGTTYFQAHVQKVQKVLTELQEAYTKGFRNPYGSLRINDLRAYRTKKFKELDSLLSKSMQAELYGGMRHPKISKRVKINAKSIEHDWRIRQSRILPSLSQFYGNTVNFANAVKTAGYLAIPLAAIETYGKIVEACTAGEEACKKTKYVEWSGFGGNVAGGWTAAYVAGLTISIVLGMTAMGGLAVVGIVAGGTIAAGYGGALAGEYGMKILGEMLYEHNRSKERDIIVETIGGSDQEGWAEF
jgi:type VI protein secretion system component Hcp